MYVYINLCVSLSLSLSLMRTKSYRPIPACVRGVSFHHPFRVSFIARRVRERGRGRDKSDSTGSTTTAGPRT